MAAFKLKLTKNDLKEDSPTGETVQGRRLAIVMHRGKVYALNAVCTHEEGPLDEGSVEGDEIICPWHSGAYNIMTGRANKDTNWVHDTKIYKITEGANGELSVEI